MKLELWEMSSSLKNIKLLAAHLIGNGSWAEVDEPEDIREAETIVAKWANQEFLIPLA